MAWISITIDSLKGIMADAEYMGITEASLPDGKTATEIVEEEIAKSVTEARGYVAGYASNVLAPGETIPDELTASVLAILRYRVITRLPGMKRFLDDRRVAEYEEAMRKLRDVSKGALRIVNPETPAPEQAGGSTIQVVRRAVRQVTRGNMKGLL